MNTNKEVEWRRFIVPKKVEQINDHLFIDTYKCLWMSTKGTSLCQHASFELSTINIIPGVRPVEMGKKKRMEAKMDGGLKT